MMAQLTQYGEVTAHNVGYVIGTVIALLVFLGLTVKCFAIARRPTTNSKCAYALGSVLGGWFLAALGGILSKWFPQGGPLMVGLGGLSFFGTAIVGVVLAIIGLVEYRKGKETYRQGRTQAVLALTIS